MRVLLARTFRVLSDSLRPPGPIACDGRGGGCAPIFEALEPRALMSTYYVSPGGDDGNSGATAAAAWQTIAKVNSVTLHPGDKVLFEGGKTFAGSLSFWGADGGSKTTAITIGSYGNGRATIASGSANGAYVFNVSGIWFEDLIFDGTPTNAKMQNGIRIEAHDAGARLYNVRVDHCDISGYGYGICVVGDRDSSGYTDVRLTHNTVHDNIDTGIGTCAVTW